MATSGEQAAWEQAKAAVTIIQPSSGASDSSKSLSSSNLSSSLSAQTPAAKMAEQVKELDLKKKSSDAVLSAAQKVQEQIDQTVAQISATVTPILDEFKKIPPKLRKAVDVQGAAAGVYANFQQVQKNYQQTVNTIITSVDVPITSADYYADPMTYPNLLAIQYSRNQVTDDDCLSSGYTKVEKQINRQWLAELKKQLGLPVEDRDVVEQQMEKLFNTTIKTAWATVGPLVKTVGGLAQVDTVQDMVTGVNDAVDGVVKLASEKIDEKPLDQKLAQQDTQKAKIKSDVAEAKSMASNLGKSTADSFKDAGKAADNTASSATEAASAAISAAKDAFKNLKMPEMPDDIKQTFDDLYDSIIMVMNNINSIYIVLMLNMINKILDCFNQVIGIIGVPTIPDPLGQIPQVVADAKKIMEFVMNLPMSFMECVKSIAKKKVKAVQVAQLPTPPEPVPTKVPTPPTVKDVPAPQMTWDDVIQKLQDDYGFKPVVAGKIVEDIQNFYNGSNETLPVFFDAIYDENEFVNDKGKTVKRESRGPDYKKMTRTLVTPTLCHDSWLAQHVEDAGKSDGEQTYMIALPHKDEFGKNNYYEWISATEKEGIDMTGEYGLHEYYTFDKK